MGAAIVVGGFAMQGVIRQQIRYSAFCDTMQHLEAFAGTLRRSSVRGDESLADEASSSR